MKRLVLAVALAVTPLALFAESNGTPDAMPAPGPAPVGNGTTTTTTTTAPPAAPGTQGGGQKAPPHQDPFGGMGFLLIMAVPLALMWFMASRNQKKEEARQKELRGGLKRGDAVVTIGGAHGEVASVGETTVDLRLGKGDDAAVVTFNKTAIATIAGVDAAKAKP